MDTGCRRAVTLLALVSLGGGCSAEPLFPDVDPESDARRFGDAEVTRKTLFGRPTNETGLSDECCTPSCAYVEDGQLRVWTAPLYTKADMEALFNDWVLVESPPKVDKHDRTKVCGVFPLPERMNGTDGPMPYRLVSYDSVEDAEADGALVTHRGTCGACSSLRDLAVYIANPNLSDPIRECAIVNFFDRELGRLACIASFGFDLECAQAWDRNVRNTQSRCLQTCGGDDGVGFNNRPYDCERDFLPDDEELINDCLICDEVFSVEVFRAAAGRARRNSGLPSPICRNCEGVFRVEHYYRRPDR